MVVHNNQCGWQLRAGERRIPLSSGPLTRDKGSLTWWILPLEDFSSSIDHPWMSKHQPGFNYYSLVSEHESEACDGVQLDSRFFIGLRRCPFQQIEASWHSGVLYPETDPRSVYHHGFEKAYIGLWYSDVSRMQWLQLGLRWNTSQNDYRMFLNGILVQTATTTLNHPLVRETCAEILYAGHPLFVCGSMDLYDTPLDDADFAAAYESSDSTSQSAAQTARLRRINTGIGLPHQFWTATPDWCIRLNLPLNRTEDLGRFYVQGMVSAVRVVPEGLRVTTAPSRSEVPPKPADWPEDEPYDVAQVYLWLQDYFTGDFAIEYQFKSLQRHGLGMFIARAAGLQGENFLETEQRRVTGSMRMVCWENVRNYHWEFYRQMEDTRNDTASHILMKNPYFKPLRYQAMPERLTVDSWHTLRFVHEENRISGTIDDVLVIDVEDDPLAGFGPVFRSGTIALRCMWGTDMVFRNLRIWNKNPYSDK